MRSGLRLPVLLLSANMHRTTLHCSAHGQPHRLRARSPRARRRRCWQHPWAWSLLDPDQPRPPFPLAHLSEVTHRSGGKRSCRCWYARLLCPTREGRGIFSARRKRGTAAKRSLVEVRIMSDIITQTRLSNRLDTYFRESTEKSVRTC